MSQHSSQQQEAQFQQSNQLSPGPVLQCPQKMFQDAFWVGRSSTSNKKKSPHYPCRRWGHTVAFNDKYMYLFGGFGKSENQKQWEHVFRFDCITYTWERLPFSSFARPSIRDSHTCAKLGNKLYFFGGQQNDITLNELWYFDLVTTEWDQLTPDPKLCAREGHTSLALSDRFMYIYGGWNSNSLEVFNDHWIFDDETKLFLKLETEGDEIQKRYTHRQYLTQLRESQSTVLIGSTIYIFGGQGQNLGKTQIFFKDMYTASLPTLLTLNQYFNELKNGNPPPNANLIKITLEKLKPNSVIAPTARASHSAVSYSDRYMIIIGGEGYKGDMTKDNDYDNVPLVMDVTDDDQAKPTYLKNDVWVFDTCLTTWSKLSFKSKVPQFPARCSHSCSIFKDQLIVFGGLEDIMVLHLRDSENHLQITKKEEMKNICKYCQLVYGVHAHQLEDNQIIKPVEVPKQKANITLSYVQSLVMLVDWPFTCFGLLLDNAYIQGAKKFRINIITLDRKILINRKDNYEIKCEDHENSEDEGMKQEQEEQSKIPYQSAIQVIEIQEEDNITLTHSEFLDMLYTFDTAINKVASSKKEKDSIMTRGQSAEILLQNETRRVNLKTYANNIKIACLRLGQTFLIVSKNENQHFIALVSINKQLNPNIEDVIIFQYTITSMDEINTYSDETNRNRVLGSICHLYCEDDLINLCSHNYTKIIIFDLIKLPISPTEQFYELQAIGKDIINNNYRTFFKQPNKALEFPDYSLKQYLQAYLLEREQEQQIFLQNQVIELGYKEHLQSLENAEQIDLNQIIILQPALKEAYKQLSIYKLNNTIAGDGIYVYSDGRLIQRISKKFGDLENLYNNQNNISGFIEVEEFLVPNLLKTGFESDFLWKVLSTSLKKILKSNFLKRKNLQTIVLLDEPPLRKEIKIIE